MESVNDRIGKWLSAALDDPQVCDEMKADIRAWFDSQKPPNEILISPCPHGKCSLPTTGCWGSCWRERFNPEFGLTYIIPKDTPTGTIR